MFNFIDIYIFIPVSGCVGIGPCAQLCRGPIMFNFIDIYSFIPASGCVGMGPGSLFCRGPTMLLRRPGFLIPQRNNGIP